jgi:protein O-GlcNAc transferase
MGDLTRAVSLWKGGQRGEAECEIQSVRRATPDDPTALRLLAEIYASSGRASQAIELWRRLSELNPADAGVLRQLAQAFIAERAFEKAIEALRRALDLEPASARACNNLGLAQLRGGDAVGAVLSLEQAIGIDPGYALGHMNLGLAREALNLKEAARRSYERSLELDPHLSQARLCLSRLLLGADAAAARREQNRGLESHAINLMTVGRHDEAIALWTQLIDEGADLHYLQGMRFHCQLHCCDWSQYEATAARLEARILDGKPDDLPFSFFVHSHSAQAQLQCARSFVADRHPAAAVAAATPLPRDPRRIKIAYLSFDFQEHATAYLMAGLFESHDRSRFDIVALSYGRNDASAMRTRLEKSVERFIDVARDTDREVAAQMQRLGIQIAVDLKGFTGGARTGILACRPAPVQINFLGYPGTMGAQYIDYIVADRHVIPDQERVHYAEKVIHMPHSYQPNDAKRPLPTESPSREHWALPQRGFVFCCFNNLYKITPAVFEIWTEVLRAVDGSVLWLLEGNAAAMRHLRAAAGGRGVAPERIIFAPHIELTQHLARYRRAGLFLDTSPCNAHTTASDALWMGVPVLTLTGQTFAGRVATSLLHAVGLPQLCTTSPAQYAALAIRLARTPAALSALTAHLENGRRTFPLFDTGEYCRHLEAAYEECWSRHLAGGPARPLAIDVKRYFARRRESWTDRAGYSDRPPADQPK